MLVDLNLRHATLDVDFVAPAVDPEAVAGFERAIPPRDTGWLRHIPAEVERRLDTLRRRLASAGLVDQDDRSTEAP